jgi:hypothetical protein
MFIEKIPGKKVKYEKIKDDYLVIFRTKKEMDTFAHYKRMATGLDCSIRELIIEAMQHYEKKWR